MISSITTEISRVIQDLNILISNIQFSDSDNTKTLDDIMNEITNLQNISSDVQQNESVDISDSDDFTEESWNEFVNDVKIMIANAPPMDEIALLPVTDDSELYIKYLKYYCELIETKCKCEKMLISKYNITNDLKFVYYAFRQIALNTNTIAYAYNKIMDFEVDVSDVFDTDTKHWETEYSNVVNNGVYSNTSEYMYGLLIESLQLLHKYCAFTIKLSETDFEQFTGVTKLLNNVCAATTSVIKYYDFVKINE